MDSNRNVNVNNVEKKKGHTLKGMRETHGNVTIPWKWDRFGKVREFFNPSGQRENEKSGGVHTLQWFYEIMLEVQQFKAEEFTISLTKRTILIKGKRRDKDGHALAGQPRPFATKYVLPADAIMERIECHLFRDGVLHITVPRSYDTYVQQVQD